MSCRLTDREAVSRRRLLLRLLAAGGAGLGMAGAHAEVCPTVLMEEFPPYSVQDAEGRPSGYSVELARALLARAGLEADWEFSSWARVLQRARSQPNILLIAIVRLPEREGQFHWIGQIAQRRGMLFRLRERAGEIRPRTLEEAKALRVGVVRDDVSERELLKLGFGQERPLDRSHDNPAMLRRFFAGRSDLVALNQSLAPAMLRQYGYDPQAIEPVLKFSESRPSMALSLDSDPALAPRLRQVWETLRRDGTVAAIAARHGVTAPD